MNKIFLFLALIIIGPVVICSADVGNVWLMPENQTVSINDIISLEIYVNTGNMRCHRQGPGQKPGNMAAMVKPDQKAWQYGC